MTLHASGLLPSAIALIFQGSQQQANGLGAAFGDGLLCANENVVRLGIRTASGGILAFGHGVPGDPGLATTGQLPPAGGTRNYQVWYRDPVFYCTPSTFNLTNGLQITWQP